MEQTNLGGLGGPAEDLVSFSNGIEKPLGSVKMRTGHNSIFIFTQITQTENVDCIVGGKNRYRKVRRQGL